MPGGFGGFENHGAIGQRDDRFARRPRIGQQFQATSPGFVPFRIQEHDQIQATVQATRGVVIEIDVSVELLAVQIFVRAAADVIGIVEQIGNRGDAAHE